MKVAVVSSGYPHKSGGSTINLQVLIEALQELGHEVSHMKLDLARAPSPRPEGLSCPSTSVTAASFVRPDAQATARAAALFSAERTQAVFFYGYEPLAVFDFERFPPQRRFILMGDPMHLV